MDIALVYPDHIVSKRIVRWERPYCYYTRNQNRPRQNSFHPQIQDNGFNQDCAKDASRCRVTDAHSEVDSTTSSSTRNEYITRLKNCGLERGNALYLAHNFEM